MSDKIIEGINISAMQRNQKVLQRCVKEQNKINLRLDNRITELEDATMTKGKYNSFMDDLMKKVKK